MYYGLWSLIILEICRTAGALSLLSFQMFLNEWWVSICLRDLFVVFVQVPYQTKLMDLSLLSEVEKEWVDEYHSVCREKVSSLLSGPELEWLHKATEPLPRWASLVDFDRLQQLPVSIGLNLYCRVITLCCRKSTSSSGCHHLFCYWWFGATIII